MSLVNYQAREITCKIVYYGPGRSGKTTNLHYVYGQVQAQHGFTRAVDIMSACALAAAIHVSAGELGRQLDGKPFDGLHHAGKSRQVYMAETQTQRGPYIFLTVFDQESSLGLVRMYFDEFRTNLASAAPPVLTAPGPTLNENYEKELNRNLAQLFGRAS